MLVPEQEMFRYSWKEKQIEETISLLLAGVVCLLGAASVSFGEFRITN
jgi:hypothetical protein